MPAETIRTLPALEPTPSISIEFTPHNGVYKYVVNGVEVEWNNFFYASTNETLTFTATVVMPPNLTATGYNWKWGDGSEGTGSTATHKYTQTGNYSVGLTVTDQHGTKWTARKSMYLKEREASTPTYVGSTAMPGNTKTKEFARPSGTQSGDLMVCFCWFETLATELSISGWNKVSEAAMVPGTGAFKLTTFTRIDTGSGGPYTITGTNGGGESGGLVLSFRGPITVLQSPTKVAETPALEQIGPSIITTNNNEMVLKIVTDVSIPSSGPSGTKVEGGLCYGWYEVAASSGTTISAPVYKWAGNNKTVMQTLGLW